MSPSHWTDLFLRVLSEVGMRTISVRVFQEASA